MAKIVEENSQTGFELAVIGMSGRFPGASNIHEFWNNLKNGIESLSFMSGKELEELGLDPAQSEDSRYVKTAGGVIENKEYFDASFFGYTPTEAVIMNPQMRIFHECAWEALEDAGYDSKAYNGSIGIYAGASSSFDWQSLLRISGKYSELGWLASNFLSDSNFMAAQIAYKLGLKGPVFTLQTACSTSLVTIHLACQGVLNGECDMALTGGVSVSPEERYGYWYQEGMIFSPDGHCRAFDGKAKGFAGGYGAGVVLVKALEAAIADRDHIYAVIKGTAINNDGIRKIGFTAPSIEGQAEVINMALQVAEVEPVSIGYVEAHGTGTFLGDPVEIQGLKLAFNTGKKGFCAIGSVKTNIGHLDAAAGVAGFIKTVMTLRHRLIPPSLHFETPNSRIDFINSPFYVNTKLEEWENGRYPLRAGISSFGIGGTNAHVILEEAPQSVIGHSSLVTGENNKEREYQLILLSARTSTALERLKENLANYLKKNPAVNLANTAYTLQAGRNTFKHRWMAVCSTLDETAAALTTTGAGETRVVSTQKESSITGKIENGLTPGKPSLIQIGRSWLQGKQIDWNECYPGEERHRVSLPTYPFERLYYWIEGDFLQWAKALIKDIPGKEGEVSPTAPQTTTGKKEEEPVSLYTRPELSSKYMAPANDTEIKLVDIWQRFFGFEPIGVNDDFMELGGDSLKVITVVSRIQRELDVLVPIPDFFNVPTIKGAARYISGITQKSPYISIASVEKKEFYRLASAQKRQYILYQLDIGNTVYNLPHVLQLEGDLELEKLGQAFKKLLSRHESLRTSFEMVDEEPVQRIHPVDEVEFEIEFYDLTTGNRGQTAEDGGQMTDGDLLYRFIRSFDLSRAPLLRVELIKKEEKKYILMVDMHHIITDGLSFAIIKGEFMPLYKGMELPPLTLSYKDYSEWQYIHLETGRFQRQEEYWLQEFDGQIPVLNMPTDYPRPAVRSTEGSKEFFILEPEESEGLKAIAFQQGATIFMILTAIYNIVLHKICQQEDIIIGTPTAGRRHVELEKIIGVFINTLVLRNCPAREKTFPTFLKEVRAKTLAAFENQDYPFETLVEKLVLARDTSRNPLFDVMFILHNYEIVSAVPPGEEETGVYVKSYDYESFTTMFDLTLIGEEAGDRLIFRFEYCTRLFRKETVKRIITYFKNVVSSVLEDPDRKISSIEIIPGEEKERVLYRFNDTQTVYPKDRVIHRLFEEQAERIPGHTALVGLGPGEQDLEKIEGMGFIRTEDGNGDSRRKTIYLTCGELNRRANQLARLMRKRGVSPHSIVGIIAERSLELMIGILAVMKAGGAYLPLDPNYPQERINYILEDSGAGIILSARAFKGITGSGYEIIQLEDRSIYRGEGANPENVNRPGDLVYTIYTSGSTGNPKGVMIEHRSLANFIKGMTDILDFNENESVLSLTTFSFDIFGLETIVPLTAGTRVVIGTRSEQLDMEAAARTIDKKQVSILQVTPSGLSMFMANEETAEVLKSLKYLLVGGEAFPPQLLEKVKEVRTGEIYNLYGPTETTIWSTTKELSRAQSLDIGKPIANTRIYILEMGAREILLPIGITGELFIAGDGLARGYVNRPQLTTEKFIPHPLEGGKRIYCTGDLARWLPDGAIEFIGRVDYQVKIRGFRIELGEIESCLVKHADIREAVVLTREASNKSVPDSTPASAAGENQGQLYLFAYIVSSEKFAVSRLREFLSKELPDYMIPSYFVPVDKIPLTPNGKVDRKALESPGVRLDTGVEFAAPRNNLEETIANVWEEVLNLDKIGINDNFFELGGNSLSIIKVRNKLKEVTGMAISAVAMFRYHSILLLSQYLSQEETKNSFQDVEIEEDVQMMENTMQILRGGSDE